MGRGIDWGCMGGELNLDVSGSRWLVGWSQGNDTIID